MPPRLRKNKAGNIRARFIDGGVGKRGSGVGKAPPTAQDYYEKGVVALAKLEPELAIEFLKKSLELDPTHLSSMDLYAEACIQIGEHSEAVSVLLKALSADVDSNYSRWLTLAQLQCSHDSLKSYQYGLSIMLAKIAAADISEVEKQKLRHECAQVYASMGELYLTDLCYEEDAEVLCERYIHSALEQDPIGLDGLQSMASLRLSQKRSSEATTIMQHIFTRTTELRSQHKRLGIIQELKSESNDEAVHDVPTIEFSLQTAKLLIECSKELPILSSNAIDLLTDLLNDDDENIEVWYTLGIAALELTPPDHEFARYHLERAQRMMKTVLEQAGPANFPFTEEMKLIEENLEQLGPQENDGIMKQDMDDVMDEADEEWSTDEEIS